MDILIPVADGCEEMEVVIVADLLVRAGASITLANVTASKTILASRGIKIEADLNIKDCLNKSWDLIFLAGGMPGAENLAKSELLEKLIFNQIEVGGWLAAICAAPVVVLGRKGILQGKKATCHPAFQTELQILAQDRPTERIVIDEKLVTSQGPGTAMEFGLKLIELLFGEDKSNEVKAPLVY